MANKFLHFRIVAPKKVLFEGDALSLSSKNSVGKFDILPGHANFVTAIENSPMAIKTTFKQNINFDFDFAILYLVDDKVNIYTEIQPFDFNSK